MYPKLRLFISAILMCGCSLFAGTGDTTIVRKTLGALRVENAPRIDGVLDEASWMSSEIAGFFLQNSPTEGAPVSFPTEVHVMYDNYALYIGAVMYDSSPDSIMQQLGVRDDVLAADNFRMVFDTYNTQQDAFDFTITASGVQVDSRVSDENFNAVWHSAVSILPNGWCAEIAIPWMALRFPTASDQVWGVQFTRNIQRKFELDQWALTPKSSPNPQKYWGLLTGLNDIMSPVRLSLTPYLTTIWQNDDRYGATGSSTSLSGGMGLKYGINESFTLDMTLLPDFSQVRSDDVVKNLGPFEVQFDEQRPFFTEGTDLFTRGNIFYSRRIGKTPGLFYDVPDEVDSTEKVIRNPSQSKLINATKLSGRTNQGLGIGILNAFVDNTYAVARDLNTGETRKILTEARSNYNIVVFDRQLANSSSVYVINTNVVRTGKHRSSNVTATGFSLNNKKNTWNFEALGAVSSVYIPVDSLEGSFDATLGYKYFGRIQKNSGKLQYGVSREVVNRNFDPNDLGIIFRTDYAKNRAFATYYIFNPWKIFNSANFDLSFAYSQHLSSGKRIGIEMSTYWWMQFRNFWNTYFGIDGTLVDTRDFFEPREEGRFYLRTRYISGYGGINSNENKKLSGGIDYHLGTTAQIGPTIPANPWGGGGAYLNWRASNRFKAGVSTGFHGDYGDRGWVHSEDDGTIVFGRRNIRNWENNVSAGFVFVKDMLVSVTARHYWATGEYLSYYVLAQDGRLHDYVNYGGNHDFSFNSFNVDFVYTWIFAPGSILSIAWKQNIISEESVIDFNYKNNLRNTFHTPQLNQVSVRVLYFLDYNVVRHSLKRRS
jgi:hypothetical protein